MTPGKDSSSPNIWISPPGSKEAQGVYVLLNGSEIIYVGEGIFQTRISDHRRSMIFTDALVFAIDDPFTRGVLEALLIREVRPRFNRQIPPAQHVRKRMEDKIQSIQEFNPKRFRGLWPYDGEDEAAAPEAAG
jgi:hypothetical protein